MNIGYAKLYEIHQYCIVEQVEETITDDEFILLAKDIEKEYHPVRFVYLEDDKEILLKIYRNGKITFNADLKDAI